MKQSLFLYYWIIIVLFSIRAICKPTFAPRCMWPTCQHFRAPGVPSLPDIWGRGSAWPCWLHIIASLQLHTHLPITRHSSFPGKRLGPSSQVPLNWNGMQLTQVAVTLGIPTKIEGREHLRILSQACLCSSPPQIWALHLCVKNLPFSNMVNNIVITMSGAKWLLEILGWGALCEVNG